MTTKICRAKFAWPCGLVALLMALVPLAFGEVDLDVEPAAEASRSAVLVWAGSLRSFDGSYTLHQTSPAEPDPAPITFHIQYRFQGENRYMHTEMLMSDRVATHVDALLDGDLESMEVPEDQSDQMPSGTTGLGPEHWLFPLGSLLTPEMLFGQLRGKSTTLQEFMAEGKTTLHVHDGQQVLRHRRGGKIVDIWFEGNSFQVKRFEVSHTDFTSEEVKAHWAGDEFDIRSTTYTLDLLGYMEIGQIQFPTRAVLTVLAVDTETLEASRAERDALGMQQIDWFIKLVTEVPKHPSMIQQFDLDVQSTKVNPDLQDAAFRIAYPPNAIVFKASETEDEAAAWWSEIDLGAWLTDFRFWLVLVGILAAASIGRRVILGWRRPT